MTRRDAFEAADRRVITSADGDEFEVRAPASLQVIAIRALLGTTPLDGAIDAQPLPPAGLRRSLVRSLRWYRRRVSPRLGDRCVMDPSCSRYCEQALRHEALLRGAWRSAERLRRCRPGQGGPDLPAAWLPASHEHEEIG